VISTVYRLALRLLVTRGRLIALVTVGAIAVLLGAVVRAGGAEVDKSKAVYDVIDGYCLGVLAPVVALVFASAALGDPAEDGTLVYLWLKPVARWRVVVGALAASLSVALPLVVVPTVVAAALSGVGHGVVGAAVAASVLSVVAYTTIFLGLGLKVKRALVWGLAYVLIWEGAVARTGRGAARLAVHVYARSVLVDLSHRPKPKLVIAPFTSVFVPLVVAAVAVVVATRLFARAEVT
jgi:ABC-2 type transport system permease protein